MRETATSPSLSPLLVQLLKGVLERDQMPNLWQDLLRLQAEVTDYVAVIGLELHLDEAEGYAYLKQRSFEEGEETAIPRLIATRPLSYPVSLLCVQLRKKLVESDAGGAETRVILTRQEIFDMMRVYLPHQANEAKQMDQVGRHVSKVVELGFLRELKGQEGVFEVRRILKAFVNADWLLELERKLKEVAGDAADEL